jgi:hypothetical protein
VTTRHDQRLLGNVITNMTHQRHHQHGSTTTLRHCQVDLALTSRHDQCHLGSTVSNMT